MNKAFEKDIYLLDKLLQAGYTYRDIMVMLDTPRGTKTSDIRKKLSQPLYQLNINEILAIANALDKSPMYVIDAAQFGGKDILRMTPDEYKMWMYRLATEPLSSDVRRNLSWAIGKGLKMKDVVKEYLDNHPEVRLRKTKVSPYQYKLAKDSGNLDYIDKSSSTNEE